MVVTDRFHCIMCSVLIYRIFYAYPWELFHWLNDNGTIAPVSVKWPWISGQYTLQWRHNGRDSISNHQPHVCFLNRLFRHRSKKTSKLRVTGLCAGNSPHKWPVTRKSFHLMMSWNHNQAKTRHELCTSLLGQLNHRQWYIYIYIYIFFLIFFFWGGGGVEGGRGELIWALMSYSV